MLKRVVAFLVMSVLLVGTVSASVSVTDWGISNGNTLFTVSYNCTEDDMVSILAYDVSNLGDGVRPHIDTPYVDESTTPIKGLWQEWSDGQFELNIQEGYTGRLMVVVSGYSGSVARCLLKIEDGAIRSITISGNEIINLDAAGAIVKTLADTDTVTMNTDVVLSDAMVDASVGTFTIGTTNVKGKVTFTDKGNIIAESGNTITLESEAVEEKRNIGFIIGKEITEQTDTITLTITHNDANWTRTATFENTDMFIGNLVFGTAVQGVPEGISADGFEVTIK